MVSLFSFILPTSVYYTMIFFFCFSFLFFVTYFIVSNKCLKDEPSLQKKNTLLNTLPIESFKLVKENKRFLPTLFIALGLAFYFFPTVLLSFALISSTYNESFRYLGIILLVVNVVLLVFAFIAFCYPNFDIKKHVIFVTLFMILFVISNLLSLVSAYQSIEMFTLEDYSINFWIGVCFGIIGLILAVIMLNPKLVEWAKLDKTEVDGATYYVRPKKNYLAITEWLFIGALCVNSLLNIINLFLKLYLTTA